MIYFSAKLRNVDKNYIKKHYDLGKKKYDDIEMNVIEKLVSSSYRSTE